MKYFGKRLVAVLIAAGAALVIAPESFSCHGLLRYRFMPIDQARQEYARLQAQLLKEKSPLDALNIPAVDYWVRYYQNPVFRPGPEGSWEEKSTDCFTIGYYQNQYWMWYVGTPRNLSCQIGLATSPDGINWTRHPDNPVIRLGDTGSWDSSMLLCQHIIFDKDENIFKMWYVGGNAQGHFGIGFATSTDGAHWTKYAGNPVIQNTDSWEGTLMEGHSILRMNGVYKMWYGGIDINTDISAIGYATSNDGIHWTKYAGNPVLVPGVGNPRPWDGYSVDTPDIHYDGKIYEMFYRGWRRADGTSWIGRATSTDGVQWTKDPDNPIFLTATLPGSWDAFQIYRARVFWADGVEDTPPAAADRMWYTGRDSTLKSQVGLAFSPRPDLTGSRPPGRKIPMNVNQDTMNLAAEPIALSGMRLSYFTPWLDNVRLTVYDAAGRTVRTLVREAKMPGFYEIDWNGRDDRGRSVSSGLYFVELASSNAVLTKEIVFGR